MDTLQSLSTPSQVTAAVKRKNTDIIAGKLNTLLKSDDGFFSAISIAVFFCQYWLYELDKTDKINKNTVLICYRLLKKSALYFPYFTILSGLGKSSGRLGIPLNSTNTGWELRF